MDKLKSAFTSFSASAKLSKAFHFNSDGNVLSRSHSKRFSMSNPFLSGSQSEERSLPRVHLIMHCVALIFTFLAICTMAAVAAFQAKWFSVSGGTGFVLFLLLLSFFMTMALLVVPITYDRWDKMKRFAQFLAQTRSTLILHAFGAFLMLIAAFIVTISAWTEAGCKDTDNDPHESLGDDYTSGLTGWCKTKKASAIFDWLSLAAWTTLLVLTGLAFRRGQRMKHGDSSFIPPEANGISYSNILATDDARYADKTEERQLLSDTRSNNADAETNAAYDPPSGSAYGYRQPAARDNQAQSRPGIDTYGNTDAILTASEPSRTMQMAYTDPYANLRQQLMNNSSHIQNPIAYSNSIPPGPPTYSGFRQH